MDELSAAIAGRELISIVDVWSTVQQLLEIPRNGAANLVERLISDLDSTLYLDSQTYVGLWFPVDSVKSRERLISDLTTSEYGQGKAENPEGWINWRVSWADYEKIIDQVKSIAARGAGPRQAYDAENFLYIEFGAAVVAVATCEKIPISYAADWLLKQGIHNSLSIYKKVESPSTRFPTFQPYGTDAAKSAFDGPQCILEAIREHGEMWWEAIGWVQKDVDNNLRWNRDRFLDFLETKDITSGRLELRRQIEAVSAASSSKRKNDTHEENTTFTYKPTSWDWRERAVKAEQECARLAQRIIGKNQRIAYLEQLLARQVASTHTPSLRSDAHNEPVGAVRRDRAQWTEENLLELVKRIDSGLTHQALADEYGVTRQRIGSLYRRGKNLTRRPNSWPPS